MFQQYVRQCTIAITGAGEAQPVASSTTAAGKAANRRIEIYVN